MGYYSSLFAMELKNINNNKKIEINCELQNHSFVSNRYVSQALQQPLQTRTECTLKNYSASKFSQTGLHRSSVLHVCSSLPLFICIFCVIRFELLFLWYTQFGGSSQWLNLDKFRDTVSLIQHNPCLINPRIFPPSLKNTQFGAFLFH